jgi:hypothetical protein
MNDIGFCQLNNLKQKHMKNRILIKWSDEKNKEELVMLEQILSTHTKAYERLDEFEFLKNADKLACLIEKKKLLGKIMTYLELVIEQRGIVMENLHRDLSFCIDPATKKITHEKILGGLIKRKEFLIGLAAYRARCLSDPNSITEDEELLYRNIASAPHIENKNKIDIVNIEKYVELFTQQQVDIVVIINLEQKQKYLDEIYANIISPKE